MNQTDAVQDLCLESLIAHLSEEFMERLKRGESFSVEEYIERHPQHAGVIRNVLTSLQFMHLAGADSLGTVASGDTRIQPEGTLGDYRIVRELGRGGMGVVYEAVQISLGRRVALKVLPFASTLDAKQLQRFKNEAHAAAQLHHTNIVPVYATGCERAVHFYAMQYVEGRTLAQVIADLRLQTADLPNSLGLQRSADSPTGPDTAESASRDLTPPVAGRSTERSAHSPAFFRMVAQLGIQAAEALEHAHQLGIIHRDIKPANLLIEQSPAGANDSPLSTHYLPRLWITDFGLAHVRSQAGPTMSGDLVGTLRYMSPEQALAKRISVDERTDIYSLGATLYELLTLEPAFPGTDRQEVLRKIAFEEPKPPRRFNKEIPAELETIVLKAMEKNPQDRYGTAHQLAEDLQHFLDDKPIRARRPTLWLKVKKWSQRNRPVVWTAAGAFVVLLVLALVGSLVSVAFVKGEADRALKSESTAKQRLCDSLLAQAQAGRWSGLAGQRFGGLQALVEATRLARELNAGEEEILKLRNEAIACMSLPDLRRLPEYDRYTAEGTGGVLDSQLQRYAIADDQGDIIIHRIPNDEEIVRLHGPGPRARRIEFSPNGQYLAAISPRGSNDKQAQAFVWDLQPRQVVLQFPLELTDPGLIWSPDSRRFMVFPTGPCRTFIVWDMDARKEIQSFSTPAAYSWAFNPGGTQLAFLTLESRVLIYDVETGRQLDQFVFPVPVKRIAWGCGGRFLAGSSAETRLEIEGWRIYLWDMLARQMKVLEGHRNTPIHLAFSHAGDLLASNSWDGTIRLWDPWMGKELLRTEGDWGALRFSPDDRFLQVGVDWSNSRRCWEVFRAGREYRQLFTPDAKTISLVHIRFSPDGRFLAAECSDGVRLWDVASGRHAAWLSPDRGPSFSFDPSGKYLLTRGSLGNYRWPLAREENPRERKLRIGPPEKISAEAPMTARRERRLASPDGKWLVSNSDKGVRVWDARTDKPVRDLTDTAGGGWFSPDSKWLIATDRHSNYLVWQTASWTLRYRTAPRRAEGGYAFAAFSPDSQLTALFQSAGAIRLIHLPTGREIATLPNHEACPLRNFAFSPDGTQLAATTRTNFIELWDLSAIREQLKKMDLDWDLAPYLTRGPVQDARPLEIQADTGHMMNKEKYSLIVALFPFHAEAYYERGLAHARALQWREAIADFSRTLALKPHHAMAYYARELIRSNPDELGAGVGGSIDGALTPGPEDPSAQNSLAWVLATCPEPRFRDPSRAVELAKKAVELAPKASTCRNTLGVAYYRAGHFKEAIEQLLKAEELRPGAWTAWNVFFLSMAYWQVGDKEKARQSCAQAVEWTENNRPNNEELRRFQTETANMLGIEEKKHHRGTEDTKKNSAN
jgi:serine/threonine protein kinase/WD40 repeat protein/tetratricopeptide (TPR) repeat protein